MAASDARPIARKNVAYRVTFPIWDADGDLVTGATGLDSEVSIDGGTFADCTNEATEIATSSGMYYLDLTAAEMNGDTVSVIVKTSTSGAKTTPMVFYPEELGDIRVDVGQISGDATAADNAESFFDGTGYAGTGNTIPTVTTVTNMVSANVTQLSGDSGAADNAESFFDGTGYAGTNNVIPSVTTVTGNVNGSVASVTADVGITQAGADKVWNTTTRTLSAFGFSVTVSTNNDKTGYSLSSAGVQAIWDALTSALTTANSIGKRLADNIDATISSRLATSGYTAPTTPPTVVQIRTEMDSNSTKLANLDATVGSRLADADYTEPPSTSDIATAVWAAGTRTLTSFGTLVADIWSHATRTLSAFGFSVNLSAQTETDIDTILARTDVATSTRLAGASYTAPDNAGIATIQAAVDNEVGAIKAQTDRFATMIEVDGAVYRFTANALEQGPAGGGGGGSGATAQEVWEYTDRTLTQFGALTGIEFTYTLTNSSTSLPIAGATVTFTTDEAGTNAVWVGTTDTFGVARDANGDSPRLDAGTYYVFRALSGYTFSNPDTEVVS